MNKLDQVSRLYKVLRAHRYPVPRQTLQEKLECSPATVKRLIPWCRDILGMPIRYDRAARGYRLDSNDETFEIPGLWLTQDEIHALTIIDQLLANLAPGLLKEEIGPFRQRLDRLLKSMRIPPGEHHRIRLLHIARRQPQYAFFPRIAQALLQRRRLDITYHSRGNDRQTRRSLSPQRLVHYRDNWYLDAWCHHRNALRTFSVDRITEARLQPDAAIDIDEDQLDDALASSYGIFSGKPRHLAVIRFTPRAARWIASEQWHPDQQGRRLDNGGYELRIPYSDPTELIGDILRHGPTAEVIDPPELRTEIANRIAQMQALYTTSS